MLYRLSCKFAGQDSSMETLINPINGKLAEGNYADLLKSNTARITMLICWSERTLLDQEAEMAKLLGPASKEALDEQQQARLRQQEAEIARLRAQLSQGSTAERSSNLSNGQGADHERSPQERHHLFEMPEPPGRPVCR